MSGIGISPFLSEQFNAREWEQFRSLSREQDPEIYFEGLFQFGMRLESEGQREAAGTIYAVIARGRATEGDSAFHERKRRAQQRLDALHGLGSLGLRAESAVTGFLHGSQDFRNLMFLLAGDVLLRATRPALHRLWLAGKSARVSRYAGPEFLAGYPGISSGKAVSPALAISKGSIDAGLRRRLSLAFMSSKTGGYARERIWKWVFEKRPIEDIARSINGTYLTGNVHDLELAQKFVRFYRQLPLFSRPEVRAKTSQESLEFRLLLAQREAPIQIEEILKFLQWRETSPALPSLSDDLGTGKLEILLKYRVEMEMVNPYPSYSLFISPSHNPSKKPQIWILGIPPGLFPGETARHIYLRATDLAHEYEHFRHYRELLVKGKADRLKSEMRAWLEEYLFRMRHGDLDFFTGARLSHPGEFGAYFRIWVESQISRQ